MNPSDFDASVDRRLAELQADKSSFLQRFDADQDGVLDALELQAARAVIAHELLTGASTPHQARLVNERFELLSELGHGAQGVTHLGRDRQTGELVAVKVMNLKTAKEWKAIELFQREVEALRRLSHPQIPAFVDAFDIDEAKFFLVQDFVPGDNLMVRLARKELINEARLRDIAEQLLGVLAYLHSQSPPVLHRDVKPANIIIGDDGKVSLVDFGAVQNQGSSGTTVVGTTGYMPPEQLTGRAVPASDVYAVGALLVHAATRVHPAELEVSRLKLQWRARARVADPFAGWIDRLISPEVEDRPRHADEALRWLKVSTDEALNDSKVLMSSSDRALVRRRISPDESVSVTQDADGMTMVLDPASWTVFLLKIGLFAIPALVVAFAADTVFSGLMILLAGSITALAFAAHFRYYRAQRTLKFTPERVELFTDGTLETSMRINELDGPAVYFGRTNKGLHLLKKSGETFRLTHIAPGRDEEWAAHEIRKHLAELDE